MKNLELAKKLAVLGMIFHAGLISEEEYGITKEAYDEKYDDITRKIKQEKKNETFMLLT